MTLIRNWNSSLSIFYKNYQKVVISVFALILNTATISLYSILSQYVYFTLSL